ncbi:MAG: hypothetical protein LQ350_004541 [Teloschistes chrysophthalmus]|nr:MAG: hypothetical protein LQ350_004541 [Niorma chrysophthalma]
MSGRSAYVRAKNTEKADKKLHSRQHSDGYGGYEDPQDIYSRPAISANPSYVSSPRPRRRQSLSSSGSTYGYPPPSMRKPRPIIVASAIEKSDFRTHLDGMSATLRGKLGRMLRHSDDGSSNNQQQLNRRLGAATASSDSDYTAPSTHFTPSLGAVPSLTPSTSPSDDRSGYYSAQGSQTHTIRSKQQQQENSLHKIRSFEGGGKLPQLAWKSLSNTPELWDEQGDTLVYMYMRGSRTKPPPSFRISSRVVQASGSKHFIDQLYNAREPEGWPEFIPNDKSNCAPQAASNGDYEAYRNGAEGPDAIRPISSVQQYQAAVPSGVSHELYVPWPGADTGIHSTIWHIATRNFFAVVTNASALVGTTLHEAMYKLFERVNMYSEYLDDNIDKIRWITSYLERHKFDDVRNNPSYAASLLAFSETPGVRWKEGYIEAFVHCVGMLNMGLRTIPEWKYLTSQTKMFMESAALEIEDRLHRAQRWLLTFDFTAMWPTSSAPQSTARSCFDRLRKWLCKYYENAFLHWPPTNDATWLTRDMVVRLKSDFHSLYDYLVDRDIMFDGSQYRPNQKWVMSSKSGQHFKADTYDLPITDILLGFDNNNGFPHIPHPYCLTPPASPATNKPKSSFTLKKPSSPTDIQASSRRKALSYSEASNVYTLRDQFVHTELIANYIRFEQSDMIESIDPYEARRGRWMLIYGVLQVLATVSVDSPNLRYKEGVQYHLSPMMKGVVPWAEEGSPPEPEAEHTRSYCWTVPETWTKTVPKARSGTHKPIIWGQYGDGRVRAESSDKVPSLGKPVGSSVSRKRAEEWVNNTPTVQAPDLEADAGLPGLHPAMRRTTSAGGAGGGGGDPMSVIGSDYSSETPPELARRRRAVAHGFTDFKVPEEW